MNYEVPTHIMRQILTAMEANKKAAENAYTNLIELVQAQNAQFMANGKMQSTQTVDEAKRTQSTQAVKGSINFEQPET